MDAALRQFQRINPGATKEDFDFELVGGADAFPAAKIHFENQAAGAPLVEQSVERLRKRLVPKKGR